MVTSDALQIAPTARISKLADIEPSVRGTKIVIEDEVYIDSFVRIRAVGGSGDVRIGRRSYLNAGTVIYSGNGVDIGEGVLVAANCTIAPTNHAYTRRDQTILEQRFAPSKGGIVIEDDVWLGANVVVLDGARIAKGCVVAALSVVRGTLEPYGIYGGNPLRKLGERT
ncbi:MAG: acyltransferase [Sandaracinaceae bacterium]|nr:acyltransferase [Sandaracinaceae bacterium]